MKNCCKVPAMNSDGNQRTEDHDEVIPPKLSDASINDRKRHATAQQPPAETDRSKDSPEKQSKFFEGFRSWLLYAVIGTAIAFQMFWTQAQQVEPIPFSRFLKDLNEGKIKNISVGQKRITGTYAHDLPGNADQFVTVPVEPQMARLLAGHNAEFTGAVEDNFWGSVISWLVPMLAFFGFWVFMLNRAEKQTQGGLMSIGKSKARVYMEDRPTVTFADVAGVDEAKDELKEVVAFLMEPERYGRLGGRMPKGILLIGPSGTGKTL